MVNTKVVILLIVASVLVAAVASIAFAQYANAQSNGNSNIASQTPQGSSNTGYSYPQQGYYPYGSGQYASFPGYSSGMGMRWAHLVK